MTRTTNMPRVVQIAAKIILVDRANNRLEVATKFGNGVEIFITSFPPFFVWPKVGEKWMIRRENNSWSLAGKIQNPNEDIPLTNDLDEGEAYVHATSIRLQDGSTALSSSNLQLVEGANAPQGVVTLAAGQAIVTNTLVTANSRIQLTIQQDGLTGTPGAVRVSSRVPGISFTIKSTSSNDTSIVAYQISEPAT